MPQPDEALWPQLFGSASADAETRKLRCVRRAGEPWLALPLDPPCAAATLSLYAPQRRSAQFLRTLLALALRCGIPLPVRTVRVSPSGPIGQLAREATGAAVLPQFGILAGNPRSLGRRFVLLVCGARGEPLAVIKAGCEPSANALIARERDFLTAAARHVGVPQLRSVAEGGQVSAFAMNHVSGKSPGPQDSNRVFDLLNSWIDTSRTVQLKSLPQWPHLKNSGASSQIADCTIHPVLAHGDFAPWNLRVSLRSEVTALDWERGECEGVPAWDWLHYFIQPAVLVHRLAPPAILAHLDDVLSSPDFLAYAERAGIKSIVRPLTLAYLDYVTLVLRPSEGAACLTTVRELFAHSCH